MSQRKGTQLVSMRTRVQSLALLSGLRILRCPELWCRLQTWHGPGAARGVGGQLQISWTQDPALLHLWLR